MFSEAANEEEAEDDDNMDGGLQTEEGDEADSNRIIKLAVKVSAFKMVLLKSIGIFVLYLEYLFFKNRVSIFAFGLVVGYDLTVLLC